ncbi:hypothetical protein ACPA54_03435 [Uniformispora flossi]|uniref:hypothetical protein n=1 Tax=Uniformispora flossi TaxID=3390723 RepID=UPI003C2D3C93
MKYLDDPELPLPAPSGSAHRDVATWIVDATGTEDAGPHSDVGPVSGLLAETDQPALLAALDAAFFSGVEVAAYLTRQPDRHEERLLNLLWRTDGSPTALARVVAANPNLPVLGPEPDGEPPCYTSATEVLIAALKGRLDLVEPIIRRRGPHGTVNSLRKGISLAASDDFKASCRRAFRQLEHPVARDDVCRLAILGDPEARAAAASAQYAPTWLGEDSLPAFLFATEQWERYEAADPDARQLFAYCAAQDRSVFPPRTGDGDRWWELRRAISFAAEGSGRPNPTSPQPPTSRTSPRSRTGPIGSWPTNPGTTF